jgi:hypothetical protein
MMTYQCAVCGESHEDLPDIGFQWPDPYFAIPEAEREERIFGNSDTCVIDDQDYFVRGVILIPIHHEQRHLGLGVWVSQKRENFQTYLDNFDSPDIGPFFGWLSNKMPIYKQNTWGLKTMVRFQGNGQRPLIDLGRCEHSLYVDYSNGITIDRAWEIVHGKAR